jgi:hypothetical protein
MRLLVPREAAEPDRHVPLHGCSKQRRGAAGSGRGCGAPPICPSPAVAVTARLAGQTYRGCITLALAANGYRGRPRNLPGKTLLPCVSGSAPTAGNPETTRIFSSAGPEQSRWCAAGIGALRQGGGIGPHYPPSARARQARQDGMAPILSRYALRPLARACRQGLSNGPKFGITELPISTQASLRRPW